MNRISTIKRHSQKTAILNNKKDENNEKNLENGTFEFFVNESNKLKEYLKGMVKSTLNVNKSNTAIVLKNNLTNIVKKNKDNNTRILNLNNSIEPLPDFFINNLDNREIGQTYNFDLITDPRSLKKIDTISDSEVSADIMIDDFKDDFVLDINSFYYQIWELIISFGLFYIFVIEMYIFAFLESEEIFFTYASMIIDSIYVIDFIKHFFVPYHDFEENLIKNRKMIVYNYFTNGMFIDIITAIPFSIIFNTFNDNSNSHYKFIRIAKISRITKLTKILKLTKLVKTFKKDNTNLKLKVLDDLNVSSNLKRFLKFFIYFMLFMHISSCLWIFVSKLEVPNWMTKTNSEDNDNFSLYIDAIYFNLSTIFTVGYGDISSSHVYERLYNIFLMMVGVLMYSFAITSLSNIVAKIDKKEKLYNKRVDFLEEIRIKYKLDKKFHQILYRILTYDLQINRINKKVILNELPQQLQYHLILQIYKYPINNLKIFENTPDDFKYKAVTMLKQLKMYRGEYLIKAGDFLEETYFVKKGILQVEIILKENKKFRIMRIYNNENFGEIYMTMNIRSPINLVVKSKFAELYLMTKKDFIALNEEFPEIIKKIIKKSLHNSANLELKAKNYLDNNKYENSFFNNPNSNFVLADSSKEYSDNELELEIEYEKGDLNNLKNLQTKLRTNPVVKKDDYDFHLVDFNSNYKMKEMTNSATDNDESPVSKNDNIKNSNNLAPQINISYNINIQNNLNFGNKLLKKRSKSLERSKSSEFSDKLSNTNIDSLINYEDDKKKKNTSFNFSEEAQELENNEVKNKKVSKFNDDLLKKSSTKTIISDLNNSNNKDLISIKSKDDSHIKFNNKKLGSISNLIKNRKLTDKSDKLTNISEEINKINNNSLFNNIFTDKLKKKLSTFYSSSIIEKNSDTIIVKKESTKKVTNYSKNSNVERMSIKHFNHILTNMKKDALVLNPLKMKNAKIEIFDDTDKLDDQTERLNRIYEKLLLSVIKKLKK